MWILTKELIIRYPAGELTSLHSIVLEHGSEAPMLAQFHDIAVSPNISRTLPTKSSELPILPAAMCADTSDQTLVAFASDLD